MVAKSKKIIIFDLDDTLYKEIYFLKSAFKEIALTVSKILVQDSEPILEAMLDNQRKNIFEEIINLSST